MLPGSQTRRGPCTTAIFKIVGILPIRDPAKFLVASFKSDRHSYGFRILDFGLQISMFRTAGIFGSLCLAKSPCLVMSLEQGDLPWPAPVFRLC